MFAAFRGFSSEKKIRNNIHMTVEVKLFSLMTKRFHFPPTMEFTTLTVLVKPPLLTNT